MPQHVRENKAHLVPSQVLADAIAGTVREWLQDGLVVVGEARVVVVRQPAFRDVLLRQGEVAGRVVGSPIGDEDGDLENTLSISLSSDAHSDQQEERLTFPGTCSPSMIVPPLGVSLGSPPGTGG